MEFVPEVFEFFGGIEIFLFEFGFHVFDIVLDDFIDVFDLFSGDEKFSVILVTFLRNGRKFTAVIWTRYFSSSSRSSCSSRRSSCLRMSSFLSLEIS